VGSLLLLRRHRELMGLASIVLFGYIAQTSLMSVYVIYTDFRFHWSELTTGLSLGLVGIFTGLYSGMMVKRVVARIGERGAILFGLVGGILGYTMFGLSRTGLLLWCSIPVLNLMSLAWPSAQSLMTHRVDVTEQGKLQGALQSLRGLAGLVGPGLFTGIFAWVIGPHSRLDMPGLPFFLAAGLLAVSFAVAFFATRTGPAAGADLSTAGAQG
jgi:DHA1 family tetracycline resistance protein-like MFS transporter